MRLLVDENIIAIGIGELVSVARRKACPTLPMDENEPVIASASRAFVKALGLDSPKELALDAKEDGICFRIMGSAEGISEGEITIVRSFTKSTRAIEKATEAQCRGEGFILAKMLMEKESLDEVALKLIYTDEDSGDLKESTEKIDKKAADTFFKKCMRTVRIYAAPEIERVKERVPSMKGMRFPYADVREGQEEFIRRAYKTFSKGGTLFAAAPTGTGKTVSAIYPAIKAIGDGRVDKAFYLTPKTTTAQAASDCVRLLTEKGARIRAIILTSKERSCKRRMVCRDSHDECDMIRCNKISEAVMEVYNLNKPVIDITDIWEISTRYAVCPYEIELSYSELCDLVICDFNYLFDPVVYIRRFFTEGGKFAFLVDEAHNLADRGREMYSQDLAIADIDALLQSSEIGPSSKLRDVLPEVRDAITDTLISYLRDDMRKDEDGEDTGATHLSFIPEALYELITRMREALEDEEKINQRAKDNERLARLKIIRTLYYKVKKLEAAMAAFDSGYRVFIFYSKGALTFKIFCVDTGRELQKRIDKGFGTLFFSATLSPIEYYRSLLCDDKYADVIETASPFVPEQLSVSIMDKISTRYSERSRTLPAIARVIAATLSAKRGHYMVFAPSFEYAEALYGVFSEKYPKINCMLQKKDISTDEKREFLEAFSKEEERYLLGFCVMGGIYSEGVDLAGDKLIGAIVIGIGIPSLSYERECIAEYFEDKYEAGKQFAYVYPGMNRVFQAAGRVIRREDDRGVIVLIDDRFLDPIYKKSIPTLWRGMEYIGDPKDLRARLDEFWLSADK